MDVTCKTVETNRVELTITITAEEFAKGLDFAFEKVRKDVTVEGFRKGKIPRGMFEKKFGVEVLYDDALNAVLPDAYRDAVETSGILPIDAPDWDIKELSKEGGVVATATVWVKPEVELGAYKGLEVTRLNDAVTEDEIQAEIDTLVERQSEMVIKEEEAVLGDTVVIDYEGFLDDIAFEGGQDENHSIELGSNSFIPGFEEQIVGMAAGDEKDIYVTFPEDYQSPDLAGADARFRVKVHEVKTRQLPEVDDEFVKDLDEDGIDTVEELRTSIEEKLLAAKKSAAETHVINSVIEQAVRNAEFEIPEVMIENEVSNMVRRMEQQVKQQGITLEMYLMITGETMESMRKELKPEAIKNLEQSLIIDAIITKENIEVSDEEVEKELANMAEIYKMEVEQIKEMFPDVTMLKAEVKSRKTIDMLVESTKQEE